MIINVQKCCCQLNIALYTIVGSDEADSQNSLLMFDHLTHSEGYMRSSHIPGLRTLTKVTILVSEPEHLNCRTLAQGVSEGINQVSQSQAHESVAELLPRLNSQPGLSDLCDLTDQLGDGVGSVGLGAPHAAGEPHLQGHTEHDHGEVELISVYMNWHGDVGKMMF